MKAALAIIFIFILIGFAILVVPQIWQLFSLPGFFGSGDDRGVFKSVDIGENFVLSSGEKRQNISGYNILDLAINPSDSNLIYAGTMGAGLYLGADGGAKWSLVLGDNLDKNTTINKIVFDRKNPNNIYLAVFQNSKGNLLKSVDGGKSFNKIYQMPLSKFSITDIKLDYSNSNIMYVGTDQGSLLESRDGGGSWKLLYSFAAPVQDIILNYRNGQDIFVATREGGIFRSANRGSSFEDLSDRPRYFFIGFSTLNLIRFMAMDPVLPSTLYLGGKFGLLRSLDYGESWSVVKTIIPSQNPAVSSFAVDPADNRILYVGAGANIYKSVDFGDRWSVRQINTQNNVSVIKVNPKNTSELYVGVSSQ